MANERKGRLAFSHQLKLQQACVVQWRQISLAGRVTKETLMKLLPIAAVVAALSVAPVALAQQATTPTPTNKADCENAKMKWDAKGGKDAKGACVAASAAAPAPAKSGEAPKK